MDFYDILLAKKLDGGGSSVEVEPLSVTENGTYQEDGKAYSPVSVNVSGGGLEYVIPEQTVTTDENGKVYLSNVTLDPGSTSANAMLMKIVHEDITLYSAWLKQDGTIGGWETESQNLQFGHGLNGWQVTLNGMSEGFVVTISAIEGF